MAQRYERHIYGAELAEALRADMERTRAIIDRRDERIANCETDIDDCFVSMRADQQAILEIQMKLEILAGDGMTDAIIIVDADGNDVGARWVETRYGSKYVARGIFANSPKALMKKTGWTEKTVRVPVWVKFSPGSGGGMCAAFTGTYMRTRWHTNMVTGEYFGFPE